MTSRHANAVPAPSTPCRRFGRRFGAVAATAVALALLGASACSVDRRSGDYRCTDPAQCPSGMCDQGWCVPVAGQTDASPMAAPDAAPGCPAVCSRCNLGTCIIECVGNDACPALVTCPAGWACDVECQGTQSCRAGVSCGDATSCAVSCDGISACSGGVTCGLGACDVECSGLGACLSIDCSESCACDTNCDDGAPCALSCPTRGSNCQRNAECTSSGCNSC